MVARLCRPGDRRYDGHPFLWHYLLHLVSRWSRSEVYLHVVTIVLATLVTLVLGNWTWERGMKDAGSGWKNATISMLVGQLALVCLGAAARL